MDNINDKVNIHVGEGGGSGGGNAAMIAALLNGRNQDSTLGPLLAAMGGGGGFGGNNSMLPILLLALLGGRRGGFLGGGEDCGAAAVAGGLTPAHAALLQTLMEGQSDLRAQVPTVALETQNAVQSSIAQLALGLSQGLANVKDSVQANGTANLIATKDVARDIAVSTLQNQIAITADGDKTRALIVDFNTQNLQRELAVAQAALSDERHHRHSDGVELRVTQQVNQAQGQAQNQWQTQRIEDERFARLNAAIIAIGNSVQKSRADQDIINLGTMLASGVQTPTTTQVNR